MASCRGEGVPPLCPEAVPALYKGNSPLADSLRYKGETPSLRTPYGVTTNERKEPERGEFLVARLQQMRYHIPYAKYL